VCRPDLDKPGPDQVSFFRPQAFGTSDAGGRPSESDEVLANDRFGVVPDTVACGAARNADVDEAI
jgi:hypothetical protein